MSDNTTRIENNKEKQQYEIQLDNGQLAVLTYQQTGDRITYLHTGVPPAFEGHGLAAALAHTALEDARSAHLTVIPSCPFVARYIEHHPDYQPLIAKEDQ